MIELKDNTLHKNVTIQDKKHKEILKNSHVFAKDIQAEIIKINESQKDIQQQLVFEVFQDKENELPVIRTENLIGQFEYAKIQFDIRCRFSDVLLERMLNFLNDVYLIDIEFETGIKNEKDANLILLIISRLFIQLCEKAYLLGLPLTYVQEENRNFKIKGSIDFNDYINRGLYDGKIKSKYREQNYAKSIINVIYKAIQCIPKNPTIQKEKELRIGRAEQVLYQNISTQNITDAVLYEAKNHKALLNPIYQDYRKVLEYAEILIKIDENINYKSKIKKRISAYLLDISGLWETYLAKLIQISEIGQYWEVRMQEEIIVYSDAFFKRKIKPDIVLVNKNNPDLVAVFDAKFKSMHYQGTINDSMGDLDRVDFFQIHTYISYYQNMGKKVIAGGLLYPITKNADSQKYWNLWNYNNTTKLIIDGIDVSKFNGNADNNSNNSTQIELIKAEKNFINNLYAILI